MRNNIERRPVAEYAQVSSLITAVLNNRPPLPKFNLIWDVQYVTDYLKKELPNNSGFSDKLLTSKVAMLLALTLASRSRGIYILDTRFMVKTL